MQSAIRVYSCLPFYNTKKKSNKKMIADSIFNPKLYYKAYLQDLI